MILKKIKGNTNIGGRDVNNITNVPKRFISEKIKRNSLNLNISQFLPENVKNY